MTVKLAIPLIWFVTAVVLFRLLGAWDQLPERVAVHFGISMQPDGWSSRTTLAVLIVLVLVGHASLATWLIMSFGEQTLMIAPIQAAVAGVLGSVFWQVISFNTDGKPFRVIWIVLPVLLMIALSMMLVLGRALPHSMH